MGNYRVQCGTGENMAIISKYYLSLFYSFRGSNPSFIRDFVDRYKGAERLHLSTNYRCKANILNAVIPSIEENKVRVDKTIKPFEQNTGGDVYKYATRTYNPICKVIKENTEHLKTAEEFQEHAILVRTNNLRMILTDILIEQGVRVDIGNLNYSLRKNKNYQTILGIITAIKDKSNSHFGKYMRPLLPNIKYNVFQQYEVDTTRNWYKDIVIDNKYNTSQYVLNVIKSLEEESSVQNMVAILWKELRPYYEKLEKRGFGNVRKVAVVFRHLFRIGHKTDIYTFKASEQMKENQLQGYHGEDSTIKIHTFHSVKGLEFDNVYLIGLDSDVIPDENFVNGMHAKIGKYLQIIDKIGGVPQTMVNYYQEKIEELKYAIDDYVEEERRLFYVAWTRAKENLHYQFTRKNPSMFIDEINESYVTNTIYED